MEAFRTTNHSTAPMIAMVTNGNFQQANKSDNRCKLTRCVDYLALISRYQGSRHRMMAQSLMYFVHTSISATGSPVRTQLSNIFFNISDAREESTSISNDIVRLAREDAELVEADNSLNGYIVITDDVVRGATILSLSYPSDDVPSYAFRLGFLLVQRSWEAPSSGEEQQPRFKIRCKTTFEDACIAAVVIAFKWMDHTLDGRQRNIAVAHDAHGFPTYTVERDNGSLVTAEVLARHVSGSTSNPDAIEVRGDGSSESDNRLPHDVGAGEWESSINSSSGIDGAIDRGGNMVTELVGNLSIP
ncbi:hypothetical protein CC86DRAFT_375217 [Ophiobolus disseminans]|uniref:Uncharacterized protein n=1 Tax=Ophiobolus disseminans TaxID=1469910 RepID=A0A6A6ZGR9_9PLEO|nr:hypothetical protein CC86DRAFT_375217 [Ophiobolus disseminans]